LQFAARFLLAFSIDLLRRLDEHKEKIGAKLLPQIGKGQGLKLESELDRRQVASRSSALEVNNVDSRSVEAIRFRLALTNGDDPRGIRCVLPPGR
jgi:hypothetical protein